MTRLPTASGCNGVQNVGSLASRLDQLCGDTRLLSFYSLSYPAPLMSFLLIILLQQITFTRISISASASRRPCKHVLIRTDLRIQQTHFPSMVQLAIYLQTPWASFSLPVKYQKLSPGSFLLLFHSIVWKLLEDFFFFFLAFIRHATITCCISQSNLKRGYGNQPAELKRIQVSIAVHRPGIWGL